MRRSYVIVIAGVLALCLLASSRQRLVGDGREYLAQAINFASFHGPGVRPRDLDAIQAEMARFDPALAEWDIRGASVPDARRTRDFAHFWLYSLLAAPGLWMTRALHLPPTLSFTALNLVLLGLALWTALPRIGAASCLLIFASPVIWWMDKPHTEAYTFSLLTIAFALCEDRPGPAMIAAGAAAAQNPPIAAVVAFIWIAAVLRDRRAMGDRQIIAAAITAAALAVMHPLYTYVHHHTASLLLATTRSDAPGLARLTAVIVDPTIGLAGNFPALLIVSVAAAFVLVHRSRVIPIGVGISALSTFVFLFAFSRTTNMHHGGTPSMSRYAIWLIPLSVPLLAAAQRNGGRYWQRFLWIAATTSAAASIVAFRPAVAEYSREPTTLATFLWTRFPSWNNPIAEVFSETELQLDDVWIPVATPGCEKVLTGGTWPIPCYPSPLPNSCSSHGALCYANRSGADYSFAVAPGGSAGKVRGDAAWPTAAEPHVRRLYDAWGWRTLDFNPRDRGPFVEARGLEVSTLGTSERFILVLRGMKPGGVLKLRPSQSVQGVLVDAETGRTLAIEECRPELGPCDVDLPPGFRLLLLAMR